MSAISEVSYGARLRKSQDILTHINNYTDYQPPRYEETPEGFAKLLDDIIAANTQETQLQQTYNTTVTTRQKTFRTDPTSVFKILPSIRGYVQAQYGKDSIEFKQVDTIIIQIRNSKSIKTFAEDGTIESKISQSERSYGSTTQYFSELVTILQKLPNYQPARTELKITSLQEFITTIHNLNNQAASNYGQLKISRDNRRQLYEQLTDRANRIKAYVKANYGINSTEYRLIKGLKI
ncbi:MAG: hypothetical protein JNM36_03610 [Chitinophagales bacterium]|jgi:hypothetical protein|nr:hypothetical protein [Chitinophagales bacterium]